MKAKKHLGQHFLTSDKAINSIVKAGEVKKGDFVIEIGPGKGVLTSKLLENKATVLAVEKDTEMVLLLKERFEKEIKTGKLILINNDILETDLEKYLENRKYKLIANIPYYITGEILRLFLEKENKPERIVLLVQKEVADRIICRDGKESILSLSVKFFGEPRYIETVKAGSFSPPPKVDSAIIEISGLKNKSKEETETFFKVVKLGFRHKRKVLLSNLALEHSKNQITLAFEKLSLSLKSRAEDLSLSDFITLSSYLS